MLYPYFYILHLLFYILHFYETSFNTSSVFNFPKSYKLSGHYSDLTARKVSPAKPSTFSSARNHEYATHNSPGISIKALFLFAYLV